MTELGITNQVANMLITTALDGDDLWDRTDATAIDSGSDTSLIGNSGVFQGSLNIYRIRWISSNRIFRFNRHPDDTLNMSSQFISGFDFGLSIYLVFDDGSVAEIPPSWHLSSGGGFSSWRVPSDETEILAALNGISSGEMLLVGVADDDSLGSAETTVTETASASVSVTSNEPPVVTITAPSEVDIGDDANVSAAITDPEGETVTILWSATGGSFGNTASASTTWTPTEAGTFTITCQATDTDGQVGSNSVSITVIQPNRAPTVTLDLPSNVLVGQTVDIQADVSDQDAEDTFTGLWEVDGGSLDDETDYMTEWTAPASAGTYTFTFTATDSEGAIGSATGTITTTENNPPTISITVPSQANRNATENVSASVADPDGDTTTVLWESDDVTFADDESESTTITVPDIPGDYEVTCTVTDEHGATASASAIITVVNQSPSITITVPSAVLMDGEINVSAVGSDPENDDLTYRWQANRGSFDNDRIASTVYHAPDEETTVTITCTVKDEYDATASASQTVSVSLNVAPVVSIIVPPIVIAGETVPVIADVVELNTWTGEWSSDGGSFGSIVSEETTYEASDIPGTYYVEFEVTDEHDAVGRARSEIIVIGEHDTEGIRRRTSYTSYEPTITIEVEGIDLTDRWDDNSGLTVSKVLDYPDLTIFRSTSVAFVFDNKDGYFDYSNPDNFFLENSLPRHGRGTKVLIRFGISEDDQYVVFTGQISGVTTSLNDTRAVIKVWDPSSLLRQDRVGNFGQEITRVITNFENVIEDYTETDPIFKFPVWVSDISRGSVQIFILDEDDNEEEVEIVEVVSLKGILSDRKAEIDYEERFIRFEKAPEDGIDTRLKVIWKQSLQYKRPDSLLRLLLQNSGLEDKVGITDDDQIRFALDKSLIRLPEDPAFTSHGRPFFEKEGIARWLKLNENGGDPEWWMAHDNRLVKYDESLDEYEEITQVPDDTSIIEAPPGGYGEEIEDERILGVGHIGGVAVSPDGIIYTVSGTSGRFQRHQTDGTRLSDLINSSVAAPSQGNIGLDYYDGKLYYSSTLSSGIRVIDPETGVTERTITIGGGDARLTGISVTEDRIYVTFWNTLTVSMLRIYDHDGTQQGDTIDLGDLGYQIRGIVTTPEYIWLAGQNSDSEYGIFPLTYDLVDVPHLQIIIDDTRVQGLAFHNERIYAGTRMRDTTTAIGIYVYSLSNVLNYHSFTPYQFDTLDFENFYVLTTNTFKGDIRQDTTFNRVRVQKYVRSTDTWSILLSPATGQPQLAHPVDLVIEIGEYADNRKNFQVVRRNNKTLIFYRRVQTSACGIAYYNETDDTLTNIYSETFGSNDGLPYSMDFVLDERSDGIYVYTFVAKYTLSGSTFTSATLKVYRERVEPSASQTEIFSEDFNSTDDTDKYPISVSDVILADDRSKFYFALEYYSESSTELGKSELCELAKDGSGNRIVLKTYDNPLLGPRSPANSGSRYFYLEGNWYRRISDDNEQPNEFYYPNEGGNLIEIESDGDVVDHGIVWRIRTKSNSPDPENDIYNGWGLHNAVVSNMARDGRGNLRFVAGYGPPYRDVNNLPLASVTGAIPDVSNFQWIQWGQDLATKLVSFSTEGGNTWDLIQQLGQVISWELGFGPTRSQVEQAKSDFSSLTDFQANTSMFFRPRTIKPAILDGSISSSGSISSITLIDSGLPAEKTEFPDPPSGEKYLIIIDKEIFGYTSSSVTSNGTALSGITRGENDSDEASHDDESNVYFVDYFASGENGSTLINIRNRELDFINLFNKINISFGDKSISKDDETSIEENGEFELQVGGQLLDISDQEWASFIADSYLEELKDIRELLDLTVVFSPQLVPGQLVVIHQEHRLQIDFKLYRILNVHQNVPLYETNILAKEIGDNE